MKRILLLAMCCLMICTFSLTVSADDGGIYENAGELYEAWVSGDCVPDYITAVISTDGGNDNLTFGLVEGEAGEKGRDEIMSLVRDDSTVTIMYQTYSRNELYRIQDEIVDEYFGKDLGLVTAGVSESANKLILEVKTDYEDNADTLEMIRKVTEQYGDAVSFRYTDSEIRPVTQTQSEVVGPALIMANPQNHIIPIGTLFTMSAIVVTFLVMTEIRKRRMMAIIADGTSSTIPDRCVSKKEIETAIRNTEVEPSASLDDRVMRTICDENNY